MASAREEIIATIAVLLLFLSNSGAVTLIPRGDQRAYLNAPVELFDPASRLQGLRALFLRK